MNKIFYTIVLFTLGVTSLRGQKLEKGCCQVDSLGNFHGYWSHPSGMNILLNENLLEGVEVWVSGYYEHGRKVGNWTVSNDEGEVIGYQIYSSDGSYTEIQLRNRQPLSIIYFTRLNDEEGNDKSKFKITSILSFNKRGKLTKIYGNENAP